MTEQQQAGSSIQLPPTNLTYDQLQQMVAELMAEKEAIKRAQTVDTGDDTEILILPPLRQLLQQSRFSLLDLWNKFHCEEFVDTEEIEEIAPNIDNYVLGTSNIGDLDQRFPEESNRSSGPPPAITAHAAGNYEDMLQKAIRFAGKGLLETSSEEPGWIEDTPIRFFAGWEPLMPYPLADSNNLVQEISDKCQDRWDAAKLEVGAQGVSVKVEGFFGIIRSWLSPTDWLSLYRSQSRTLYAIDGRSLTVKTGSKYSGESRTLSLRYHSADI